MLKLKNIAVIGASALAMTAATAVTAQAQPWNHYEHSGYGYNGGNGYHREAGRLLAGNLDRLRARIERQTQRGIMPSGEARDLSNQLLAVRRMSWDIQNGKANRWE